MIDSATACPWSMDSVGSVFDLLRKTSRLVNLADVCVCVCACTGRYVSVLLCTCADICVRVGGIRKVSYFRGKIVHLDEIDGLFFPVRLLVVTQRRLRIKN